MNSLAWIGIILWGLLVTALGLANAGPGPQAGAQLAAQDVIFLVGGGLLTCLIGVTGLVGFMSWIPGLKNAALKNAGLRNAGLRNEQKSAT